MKQEVSRHFLLHCDRVEARTIQLARQVYEVFLVEKIKEQRHGYAQSAVLQEFSSWEVHYVLVGLVVKEKVGIFILSHHEELRPGRAILFEEVDELDND